MQVDKFRKLGFDIDNRVEIRENDRFGKHICAFKTIEKGDFENQQKNSAWLMQHELESREPVLFKIY